jgi:hypothetical protein
VVAVADVVAADAEEAVAAGAPSADGGSNVAVDAFEPDVADVLANAVDRVVDSVALLTVYDWRRTITAVANATVRSVRKIERNEIWTRRRTRYLQLTTPGTARVKGSISARNVSPPGSFIVYAPCIEPIDVRNGQKLVYSKL